MSEKEIQSFVDKMIVPGVRWVFQDSQRFSSIPFHTLLSG